MPAQPPLSRNHSTPIGIELLPTSSIDSLTQTSAKTNTGDAINFNLLMLVPPFRGSSAAHYMGVTDDEGYIHVDSDMRVVGQERIYAVGDCVNFVWTKDGPHGCPPG